MDNQEYAEGFDAAAEHISILRAENNRLIHALAFGLYALEHHGLTLTINHKMIRQEIDRALEFQKAELSD